MSFKTSKFKKFLSGEEMHFKTGNIELVTTSNPNEMIDTGSEKDDGDGIKLVFTAFVCLILILSIPFVLIGVQLYLNIDGVLFSNFLIAIFLIFVLISIPFFYFRQIKSFKKNFNLKDIPPLNPLTDIKLLLSKFKPEEKIISSHKGKSILRREGGKLTSWASNYKTFPESFPYVLIIETNKSYYIDKRRTYINLSISGFLLGIFSFLIFPILAFSFIISSVCLLLILIFLPFHFIRQIKKSWLKTNEKNENYLDLEGVYPRNAIATLNPTIPIVFGYPFHYKYKILS